MGGTNSLGPFKRQEPLEMTRGASTVRPLAPWHTVTSGTWSKPHHQKKNMSRFNKGNRARGGVAGTSLLRMRKGLGAQTTERDFFERIHVRRETDLLGVDTAEIPVAEPPPRPPRPARRIDGQASATVSRRQIL